MLAILKKRAWSPRIVAIAGKNYQAHLRQFWADEELALIDRVVVQSGNPLMRTTAGRKEAASELLQNGLIQTPEEYMTVIHTGETKPLTESVDAQLMKVHAENEILRKGLDQEEMLSVQLGQPVSKHAAMKTDNQVLHIRKHSAVLDSPETYGNPAVAVPVLAAIAEHVQMLLNPEVQLLQVALGFPTPFAPAPPPGQGPPTNGTQNKPKQGRKEQVPGAPPVENYPVGGDQTQTRAA